MSRPTRPTNKANWDQGQAQWEANNIEHLLALNAWADDVDAYITAIEQELDEAQGALAMQTDAIQRATAAWREKTGEELVSPDTTRLVYWLLWDREDYREVLNKVSKALDEAAELLRGAMPHFVGTALSLEEDIKNFLYRIEGGGHE